MKKQLVSRVSPHIINFFASFVKKLSRHTYVDEKNEAVNYSLSSCLRDNQPSIYAFWHGRLLYSIYLLKKIELNCIVSNSKDGEYIAKTLKFWGHKVIRGSSSKGGSLAYKKSINVIKNKGSIAITPDGPRGPYRELNPGVLRMASYTNTKIIPVGCGFSKKITLNSWDKFQIPLPFSKIVFVLGTPFTVNDISRESLFKKERLRFKKELNRVTDKADKIASQN